MDQSSFCFIFNLVVKGIELVNGVKRNKNCEKQFRRHEDFLVSVICHIYSNTMRWILKSLEIFKRTSGSWLKEELMLREIAFSFSTDTHLCYKINVDRRSYKSLAVCLKSAEIDLETWSIFHLASTMSSHLLTSLMIVLASECCIKKLLMRTRRL